MEIIKEELSRFKVEIKSCLNEHLAFIQEVHCDIEKDRKERIQERNDIYLQIANIEKTLGIVNPNLIKEPRIVDLNQKRN